MYLSWVGGLLYGCAFVGVPGCCIGKFVWVGGILLYVGWVGEYCTFCWVGGRDTLPALYGYVRLGWWSTVRWLGWGMLYLCRVAGRDTLPTPTGTFVELVEYCTFVGLVESCTLDELGNTVPLLGCRKGYFTGTVRGRSFGLVEYGIVVGLGDTIPFLGCRQGIFTGAVRGRLLD